MEINVSTSIAGLLRAVDLNEALTTVAEGGFQNLDFPLSVFSHPADSPLKSPQWRQWTLALRKKLDGLGLRVTQAHASWEQAIPQDFHFAPPYPVYARTIEACRMLGCGKLVFHPPLYFFPMADETIHSEVDAWNIRWFSQLLPLLERFDVTAALENTFDYRRVQRPGYPPFTYTTARQMLRLVKGVDSPHVALCLDTGHANISGQNPAVMIRAYGSALQALHLNDNLGLISPVYEDLHLFPGHGNLNWNEIFAALKETGFSGILNLEPVGALPTLSHNLRVIQFQSARQTLLQLAREAGL